MAPLASIHLYITINNYILNKLKQYLQKNEISLMFQYFYIFNNNNNNNSIFLIKLTSP